MRIILPAFLTIFKKKGPRPRGGYKGSRVAESYKRKAASQHTSILASQHTRGQGFKGNNGRKVISYWLITELVNWKANMPGSWVLLSAIACQLSSDPCPLEPSDPDLSRPS